MVCDITDIKLETGAGYAAKAKLVKLESVTYVIMGKKDYIFSVNWYLR